MSKARTLLKNRKTSQYCDSSGKPVTLFTSERTALFSPPSYLVALPGIVSTVPESMRQSVYDTLSKQTGGTDADKVRRAKIYIEICNAGAPQVEAAMTDPAKLEEMKQTLADTEIFVKTKMESEPSFVAQMAKTMGSAALANLLNSYLPAGALLLAVIPAAAATFTPSQLGVYGGTPPGGANMCGGNVYCKDAYIALAEDPKVWLGQVSTTVSQAVGNDGIDLAFFDCIKPGKIGEAIKDLYLNGTGTGINCFAQSIIYHGTQGTAQGTNLPIPDCSKFQQAVNPIFNNCVNYSANVGMWIGVGLASAVALAGLITLTVCCCANSSCNRKCPC